MNNPITDQELDSFFDWLKPKLPKPKRVYCPPPPAISQELLDMARQTAKNHLSFLLDNTGITETLPLPLAAASQDDLPFEIESIGGEWSVTREFTGSGSLQKLKWRCREECMELYEGRRVIAEIAGQIFDLGEIFDGIAETDIPRDLELMREEITIKIEALEQGK